MKDLLRGVKEAKYGYLTLKHHAFVDEYMIDMNLVRAYEAAYGVGKVKSPYDAAMRLVTKNKFVVHAIQKRMAERSGRARMSADQVVEAIIDTYQKCAAAKPVYDRSGKPVEGSYTFDASGANKSLEMLGRVHGIFEKDNAQTRINIPFIEITREDPSVIVDGESRILPQKVSPAMEKEIKMLLGSVLGSDSGLEGEEGEEE